MTKRIAIVGGGYIGAGLAKALESAADVTLIEQRSHFVHTPAMIRAMVRPSLLDRALIPYDGLLKRGALIRARADGVDGEGVTLEDGRRVEADYIVVATGSENAAPVKARGADIDGLRAANARVHGLLEAADHIAIVGAGAVGTELAGEISHFMPQKKITLISDQATLFPEKPARLGRELAAKLEAAGVEIVFGARAENLASLTEPYAGGLTLSDGREIAADLVFPAIGSRATAGLLESLPGAEKGAAGRIRVDGWMRPSTLPNVFAAGDAAEMGDAMTIVATARQTPWLTKTLRALAAGKDVEALPRYTPWNKPPLLVPLGPERGNSFLTFFTAGDFVTRQMKGKDLFLTKYNKLFGRT